MRSAILAVLLSLVFFSASFEAAAGKKGSYRPYYGGGKHTQSHGGNYQGGSGSSHKGGSYKNFNSGDRYGKHKP